MWHACGLGDVVPSGDLARRARANRRRLLDAEFESVAALRASTAPEAPGDWVGRALLGRTLHAQLLRLPDPGLEALVPEVSRALNPAGYLGEALPAGTADENQVAGHNALLRGLCARLREREDPAARELLRGVIRGLMLPVRPLLDAYPGSPPPSLRSDEIVGLTVRQPGGAWRGLSTDIGVLFLTLDGLTDAHGVEPSEDLAGLIEAMIERYRRIDPVAIGAQTHSTLSALRGVLRWWRQAASRPELLALVRDRFAAYLNRAQTEHHANHNWFGRPEWTEACAVVDAFLLALDLWSVTDAPEYLETAHRVFHNAMAHAQRPNGGYGCDTCVGAHGARVLAPHRFFEAPWCCSMRGAEGLSGAARAGVQTRGDEMAFTLYLGGDFTLRSPAGEVRLREVTEYPLAARVRWTVLRAAGRRAWKLRFYVPPWFESVGLTLRRDGERVPFRITNGMVGAELTLETGTELELETEQRLMQLPPVGAGAGDCRYSHGPLVLGLALGTEPERDVPIGETMEFAATGPGRYHCRRLNREIGPLPDLLALPEADARRTRTQVLFPRPVTANGAEPGAAGA